MQINERKNEHVEDQTHNHRQLDKQLQVLSVMVCVGRDEQTYFQPACGLGNDKSGIQEESIGCQTKQNPPPDAFLLPNRSISHRLKLHAFKSLDVLTASSGLSDSWHKSPPPIKRGIGCVPLNQRTELSGANLFR